MSTRIDLARVGPGRPAEASSQSLGPADSAARITVLNGFARRYSAVNRDGAFSLKWIPCGTARYGVDRLHHRVAGDKVLLLQPGQPYEVEFLDPQGTESFCLFFSETLLEEAAAALAVAPGAPADMVFTPPAALGSVLRGLRTRIGDRALPPDRLEETLLSLLLDLVAIGGDHRRLAERIPARRSSTRRFLLGRLHRAREMIEDHQGRPPSLAALAAASGLSRFHFLRLFTAAFGASPLCYAESRRVARGKALLRETTLPAGTIADILGYESQSAFAKAFRRHVGTSPRRFRAD